MSEVYQPAVNQEVRTTWMRRYTVVPELADQFVNFLTTEVFPARVAFGFRPEQVWLDVDRSQVTWFVSAPLGSADFAQLEQNWENSAERAAVFAGKPQYVTGKDLSEVINVDSVNSEF